MTAKLRIGDRVRWPGEPYMPPAEGPRRYLRRYDIGTLAAPTWPAGKRVSARELERRDRVLVCYWDRDNGDVDEIDRFTGELLTGGDDDDVRVVLVHRLPRAESRMRAATAQHRWAAKEAP